ncbi:hypothetical protein Tco_0648173, partial [Tanacetum coccineum]
TTSSIPVSVVDLVTTAGEVVTTASATTTVDELTLAQTLIEIKAAKPKVVTTAATTITTDVASTRLKAKEIVFPNQKEKAPAFTPIVSSLQASQLPQVKDKGKEKMVEPKKPLKKKDQIALDEELALGLHVDEQLAARLKLKNKNNSPLKKSQEYVVKSSMTRIKGSSKRTGDELESDKSKKKKIDEHVEAKKDDDQEVAEMKKHIEIVKDDELQLLSNYNCWKDYADRDEIKDLSEKR